MARMSAARLKLVRWGLGALVIAVVGFFFARSLADNWHDIRAEQLTVDWRWALATLLFAAAVPLTGVLWGRMVQSLQPDSRISVAEAIAVQCASWLLKYVPGQVGSVVNKILWARKKAISRSAVVISFIYENLFLQVVSIVPSAVILLIALGPEVFGSNVSLLLLPVVALIPLGVVLYRPALHAILNLPAKRVLGRPLPNEYFLDFRAVLAYLVGFLGPRILNGVGFVVIAVAMTDIGSSAWLPFAAAYTLAGAVGILAVFVPSGLGVREAVIVVIVSYYVSVPEAIILSLVARLCSTLGDGLVAALWASIRLTVAKEYRP